MRIALLHPTYWPEVRRGAERLVHDYAGWLAGHGHEVTVLTTRRGSAPGPAAGEEGFRVVRAWRPPDRLLQRRAYEDFLGAVPSQALALVNSDFDVAHAFHPVSAWAALRARRLGGPPVVFSILGIPIRRYLVERRYRMEMNLEVARDAAAVSVLSEAAAHAYRRYLLRDPLVVPPGVRTADFATGVERAAEPTIVYAGTPAEPRKRLPLLLEAFAELRASRPGLRLLLAGRAECPIHLPDGVTFVPGDETPLLARALSAAHVSVLPAVLEAFGLVLVESLAAGTPVVAARSGGCPEVVHDERVGRLFEPDDRSDLVRALEEGLELGSDAAVAAVCRAYARQWDWEAVGPRWLELAEGVA